MMPSPKEKPKKAKSKKESGRSSARSQPAISSRQAAKLLKDKYVQQLEQRQAETSSVEVQAVNQVEDAGRWAADELLIHERPRSPRQKEREVKEQPQKVRDSADHPTPAKLSPDVRKPTPQERAVRTHEQSERVPKVRDAATHEQPASPQHPKEPAEHYSPSAYPHQEQPAEYPVQKQPVSAPAPSARTPRQPAATAKDRPAPKEKSVQIGRECSQRTEQRPPGQTAGRSPMRRTPPTGSMTEDHAIPRQPGQNPPPVSTAQTSLPARRPTPTQKAQWIKERPAARVKGQEAPATAPAIKTRDSSLSDPSIVSIESIPSSKTQPTPSTGNHPQGTAAIPQRTGEKPPAIRQRSGHIIKPSAHTESRAAHVPSNDAAIQFKKEVHRQSVTSSKRRTPRQPPVTAAPQKVASAVPIVRSSGEQPPRPVRPRSSVGGSIPKIRGAVYRKSVSAPKAVRIPVKSAVARPIQNIRQNLQQRMTRQTVQRVRKAARTSTAAVKKTAAVVAKTAAAMVNALAGIAGGGVLLLAMVVIIVIAAVASSPFGLFFAQEPNAPGTVSVAQAVGTVNAAYSNRLELLQSGDYDSISIQGQAPDWVEVLAVFAVRTTGSDVGGLDVATLDADRVDKLTAVFWDMTGISVAEETVEHPDSDPDDDTDDSWTEKILHITITPQTADDMRVSYAFTEYQNSALDELLSDRAALSALAGSLTITGADEREVLATLPADLEQARQDTVQTALQLVGKVNYFWGGKSHVIGWDSRWGTLQKVTAAGSPSTGTYRSFGLDCSGMIDWVLRNCGLPSDGNWYIGTNLTAVSQANALPGDFALYPDASHIGIVVGRNEAGKLLVCHCSSGRNNVVVTEFSASGFTVVGRPDIYSP